MPSEYSENSDSSHALPAGRIIRRGGGLYLVGAVAVPLLCYIFGWRSLENYGAGFIYGGLCMAVFGLFMAAVNSLPFQFDGTRPAAGASGLKRGGTGDSAAAAGRGVAFFLTTLIAGVLLGITGFLLRLPWRV